MNTTVSCSLCSEDDDDDDDGHDNDNDDHVDDDDHDVDDHDHDEEEAVLTWQALYFLFMRFEMAVQLMGEGLQVMLSLAVT